MIGTCAASLLDPHTCCEDGCTATPTLAVLTGSDVLDATEHLRCDDHAQGPDVLGTKAYTLDPVWDTPTR